MTVPPTPGRRHGIPAVMVSMHGYRRPWLGPDLLACVTLLVIAVSEQLATSRLAGMPPITGLYTLVAGTVGFAILGIGRDHAFPTVDAAVTALHSDSGA